MTTAETALDALGHKTRRSIIELLEAGPLPVHVLASRLPISRPAVSQHLRVLKDAGLVAERVDGNRRWYRLEDGGLLPVYEYFDRFWGQTLDRFAALAVQHAHTKEEEKQ